MLGLGLGRARERLRGPQSVYLANSRGFGSFDWLSCEREREMNRERGIQITSAKLNTCSYITKR